MNYIPDIPKILEALKFAEKAHSGQMRKVTGQPYFHHTVAVALILVSFKKSKKLTDLVVAAILHDTLEDTETTFQELQEKFGAFVASLVLELTNDEAEIERIGKKEHQKQKMLHMSSYALLIKLVDRLHNLSEHPSAQMKADTKELMDQLMKKRSTLTFPQTKLIAEIRDKCLI